MRNSSPTLADCTISGNSADRGGGLYCCEASSSVVENCVITGNVAEYNGGGVACWDSSPVLTNCTISGNVARQEGGGVYSVGSSSPTLTNCIVWDNPGGSISVQAGGTSSVAFSCIEADAVWSGQGTINDAPLFLQPGHWNGDVWVEGDYHLRVESPCVDAGTPDCAPPVDIEGNHRPCCGGVDMGAYEYCDACPERFVRGDTNGDGTVNIADAVFILMHLFANGPTPTCMDAADVNDDGSINLADGIYVLQNRFASGPAIPPPYPTCGMDPTGDALNCLTYAPCEEHT